MTKEQYRKLSAPFRQSKRRRRCLRLVNAAGTAAAYIGYFVTLLHALLARDAWFWRVLLVPAAAFFIVSAFRRIRNAPRPYEVWHMQPLLPKETKGKSFPSRHVFSAGIIAMAVMSLSVPWGIVLLCVTGLLGWCRVIAGVHFVRDVAVGAAVGIGAGLFICGLI